MLNLSESNIHLNAAAHTKQQAIEMVAAALENAGNVEAGYLQGMLAREQQTSTFLGNGIAIPHGITDTRDQVKETGVQVFQFPQGIDWGEGNTAFVVIGIAARSNEHLALLRQLTQVLGDEDAAAKLATLQDMDTFRRILIGEAAFSVTADTLTLDTETESLLTLTAVNAGKLQQQSAVENRFISEVIGNAALPLGNGLWVTDALSGNLKNALAFSRAKQPFQHNGKTVHGVITVSAVNDQINPVLARLLENGVQQTLISGNSSQILTALNGESEAAAQFAANGELTVVGTFTIRNEHGLHARPSAVLVNEVKKFKAKISVQNLTRNTETVSAKSLMKIVALGATQGNRLRFTAEGEDAKAAIEALAVAVEQGLGEAVSAVPPAEPDTIDVLGSEPPSMTVSTAAEDNSLPPNAIEAVFVIHNEHGLHARPTTVLVNEVKKYNASIAVQNLDRDTQLVSAKSVIKIVALGATQGHRLRFVATGEDAQKAIDGIGAVIAAGLGE